MKSLVRNVVAVALLGVLASASAYAQSRAAQNSDDAFVQQGMTKIDEGLYAQFVDTPQSISETYVAVGAAGQRAMLAKLISIRDSRASADIDAKLASKNARLDPLDDLIQRLSGAAANGPALDAFVFGDCRGPDRTDPHNPSDPFTVEALAGGGLTGSAGASAGAWNTDPSINTTNYAYASATGVDGPITPPASNPESRTTHGTTPAVVSQLYPNGCGGASNATITCPGAQVAAISVYAHGTSLRPACIN